MDELESRSASSVQVGFGDVPRWVVLRALLVGGLAGQKDSAVNPPGSRGASCCGSAFCPHVVGRCWQLANLLVFALDSD